MLKQEAAVLSCKLLLREQQTVVLQPEDTVSREVVKQHTIVLISELPLRARQPFESIGLAPHDVPTGHKGWLSSRGDEW